MIVHYCPSSYCSNSTIVLTDVIQFDLGNVNFLPLIVVDIFLLILVLYFKSPENILYFVTTYVIGLYLTRHFIGGMYSFYSIMLEIITVHLYQMVAADTTVVIAITQLVVINSDTTCTIRM